MWNLQTLCCLVARKQFYFCFWQRVKGVEKSWATDEINVSKVRIKPRLKTRKKKEIQTFPPGIVLYRDAHVYGQTCSCLLGRMKLRVGSIREWQGVSESTFKRLKHLLVISLFDRNAHKTRDEASRVHTYVRVTEDTCACLRPAWQIRV